MEVLPIKISAHKYPEGKLKYSVEVFVFWCQQWTDFLFYLLVGGSIKYFLFLSHFLFSDISTEYVLAILKLRFLFCACESLLLFLPAFSLFVWGWESGFMFLYLVVGRGWCIKRILLFSRVNWTLVLLFNFSF